MNIEQIGKQTQTTYEQYNKINSFNDVGYFLQNYVNEGGEVTKNIKHNDEIDVAAISASFNNHVLVRDGANFKTKTPNTVYYLDFDGDWKWGTAHPSGAYLPIAEVTTDTNGNVDKITDKAGPRGGFRLKSEYGLEGYATTAQLADIANNIKSFGAKGDGITNDAQAIINANADANSDFILFTKGTYNITSNVTLTKPVKFNPGAKIKVSSGSVLVFENDVDAGEYQIVETSDDFIVNPIANTSVKFKNHRVKAEWLGALKVQNIDDIQTIPDQTGNLLKAFRAAVGDFIYNGRNITENPKSLLKLGTGCYRVDNELATGYNISGTLYYMTGSGIVGDGFASSFLIRTDLSSTKRVLSLRYYTGELTLARDFKVTAYDPTKTGSARFPSATASMIWCQGDSLVIENVWASGAQVSINDANGIPRNGVGIQFESCVDTFVNNVFVENCNTNYAFSSSTVKLNNLTSFDSRNHNIGIGNFSSEWPDSQTTGNHVTITNIDARSVNGKFVHVLSSGDNTLNITGANASGTQTGTGNPVGTHVVYLQQNAKLSGSITKLDASIFGVALLYGETGSIAGTKKGGLNLEDIRITNILNTNPVSRGLIHTSPCSDANVTVKKLSADWCRPVLASCNHSLVLEDISLSNYDGRPDASANRQLFVQNGGRLMISRVSRDSADTTALTSFGYQAAGSYAKIDITDLPNATRSITGTGTKEMTSKVAFA